MPADKLETNPTTELADERFRELADWLPIIVWRISADWSADWVNRAWTTFTGARSGNQTGSAWLDLVHPADRARVAHLLDRAFNTRELTKINFRLRRRDGEYRWISETSVPIYRDDRFAGFVGTCVDIHLAMRSAEQVEGFRFSLAELLLVGRDR